MYDLQLAPIEVLVNMGMELPRERCSLGDTDMQQTGLTRHMNNICQLHSVLSSGLCDSEHRDL